MQKVTFQDLGKKAYKDTWDYQSQLHQDAATIKSINRKNNTNTPTESHFLFVEHPHVYTLGKSGDISNLLLNEKQLEEKEIDIQQFDKFIKEENLTKYFLRNKLFSGGMQY